MGGKEVSEGWARGQGGRDLLAVAEDEGALGDEHVVVHVILRDAARQT